MPAQNFDWIRTRNSRGTARWTMWHKTSYRNSFFIQCGQRLKIDDKTKVERKSTIDETEKICRRCYAK